MTQKTPILYTAAALGAPATSSIYRNPELEPRTHIPVQVTISAGTATVNVEGRVGPGEAWVILGTLSATDILLVPANLELRANVTAAAGATIRVVTDRPLLFVA